MNKILKHLTETYTEIDRMTVYSHNHIPMVPKANLNVELRECHSKVKAELEKNYMVKKFYEKAD